MPRLIGRFVQYVLVLWVALTLNFLLPRFTSGDPLNYLLGTDPSVLSPETRAQLTEQYGLDGSTLDQYRRYWTRLAHGDLGTSVRQNRPVGDVLLGRLPWTVLLVGVAAAASTAIGIALGVAAAWRRVADGTSAW